MTPPAIYAITTMDTKGVELAFVAERLGGRRRRGRNRRFGTRAAVGVRGADNYVAVSPPVMLRVILEMFALLPLMPMKIAELSSAPLTFVMILQRVA